MLLDRLNEDMKNAMRSQDKLLLSVIRMTKAAVQRLEMDKRRPLTDEEVTDVVGKQIKTREDSINEFKKGNREDLIDATQSEIDVLIKYMPTQLSALEVETIIDGAITEIGATSMKDLGPVMKIVTPILKGKTDMSKVSVLIKAKLN